MVQILVLQFHVYEFWMWMIIHQFHRWAGPRVEHAVPGGQRCFCVDSVYDHCGYDFPWSPLQVAGRAAFRSAWAHGLWRS